jgi:hypothetical protein
MRVLLRIGLFIVQVVIFFAFVAVTGDAYSNLSAETYPPGAAPNSYFPVIAVQPQGADSKTAQYQLMRWSELKSARGRQPQMSFNLPQPNGRFKLPERKGFEPTVVFKVLETTNSGQLVDVAWYDDDYQRYARYVVDGASVRPTYYREKNAGMMFLGIIPGFIGAWFVGWFVRRRWLKDPGAPKPT